jgi:hypothetical protein
LAAGGLAGGLFASGCGGDDNNGTPPTNEDAGPDGTSPGDDGASPGDDGGMITQKDSGGGDADAAPARVHGKLILVHASAFAPAMRFCFGFVKGADGGNPGTVTVSPSFPAPNNARGVLPGTGGVAADVSNAAADQIAASTLRVYGINAAKLTTQTADAGTTELGCNKLVGDGALPAADGGLGLVAGQDYFDLGTLPPGTVVDGTTTLLAVTGCAPGAPNPTYNCPNAPVAYDNGTGNLGIWASKVDNSTAALDGGTLGAQFAFASYPFASLSSVVHSSSAIAGLFHTIQVIPDAGVDLDAGDGGDAAPPTPVLVTVPIPITQGATYGTLTPAQLAPVSGLTFDQGSGFFVSAVDTDGGPTPVKAAVPFPAIQAITAPDLQTPLFANGAGYVFVLVGDPGLSTYVDPADGGPSAADAGGQFNLFSAHILGFPTNPPFGN